MHDPKVVIRYRELGHEEVIDFFSNNGVSSTCPTCGNAASSIHIRKDGAVAVMAFQGINIDSGLGTATLDDRAELSVATECDRCGLYRNFSYKKILDWVLERALNGV